MDAGTDAIRSISNSRHQGDRQTNTIKQPQKNRQMVALPRKVGNSLTQTRLNISATYLPCVILFLCFSVLLALRSPRLGKRELILVLFVRLFALCLFWFCRFPLPLGIWEGLRFVIVAIPGLFSYFFYTFVKKKKRKHICEWDITKNLTNSSPDESTAFEQSVMNYRRA